MCYCTSEEARNHQTTPKITRDTSKSKLASRRQPGMREHVQPFAPQRSRCMLRTPRDEICWSYFPRHCHSTNKICQQGQSLAAPHRRLQAKLLPLHQPPNASRDHHVVAKIHQASPKARSTDGQSRLLHPANFPPTGAAGHPTEPAGLRQA